MSPPRLNGIIFAMLKFMAMTNKCIEDGDQLSHNMKIRCHKVNKDFFYRKIITQWT